MLFSAEAWSGVTEKQLARLEVVDTALISKLAGGHSKCAVEFHHLETGTLKLRHILSYLRIMYHHHIITRDENETIHKIYRKQKEEYIKGDWFQLLIKDFEFIGIQMDENYIKATPKSVYKKHIKSLIRKAAFKYFMDLKRTHSKLDKIQYQELKIQPYLQSKSLNNKDTELIYNLRSNCYQVKMNFKKMHKNNLKCRFGCLTNEDQNHIFSECQEIQSQLNHKGNVNIEYIYQDIDKQLDIIPILTHIDQVRWKLQDKLLPGDETTSQDPRTQIVVRQTFLV